MRYLPILALWLLSLAHSFASLDIKNPRWGFTGRITRGTFNLLTVEVTNKGGTPYDGDLILSFERGTAAPLRQKIFLAPGTSRWVQFSPYLNGVVRECSFEWGPGSEQQVSLMIGDDERKASQRPSIVVLADAAFRAESEFPLFQEAHFPSTVSATDGLSGIILDRVPRLQPQQREALTDWVRAGGVVVLALGPTGVAPVFADDLAPLNVEGNRGTVGGGQVIKLSLPVAKITAEVLKKEGVNVAPDARSMSRGRHDYNADDEFIFRRLGGVSRPELSWWLIFLMTVVYVLVIGPVFYVLRKKDYRYVLGGFVGTIVLFSWIFSVIGRRGYGESQVIHSLAIAREVGEGKYDVTHWTHAFATSGDRYQISYPGASQLYGALNERHTVGNDAVVLGKDAYFHASIPLFSFSNFLHRGVMPAEPLTAGLEKQVVQDDDNISTPRWVVRLNPIPAPLHMAVLQVGNTFYAMRQKGDRLVAGRASTDIDDTIRDQRSNQYLDEDRMPKAEAIRELRYCSGSLIKRASGTEENDFFGQPLLGGRARLYLYVDSPASLLVNSKQFAAGVNYVLFVKDLPLPPAPEVR